MENALQDDCDQDENTGLWNMSHRKITQENWEALKGRYREIFHHGKCIRILMFSQHSFFSIYKAPSGLNHTEFTPIWYLRSTQIQTAHTTNTLQNSKVEKILPIHKNLEPTEWGHKDQEMSEDFTHLLSTQCFLLISSLPPHQFGSYLLYFVGSLFLSHNLSTQKLFSLQLLIWLPLYVGCYTDNRKCKTTKINILLTWHQYGLISQCYST